MRNLAWAALLVPFLVAGCQGLTGQTERSYKFGREGPRFLASFVRPDPVTPLGHPDTYIAQDEAVFKALETAEPLAQGIAGITGVDEDIYLVLTDRPGVGYTVHIHNGDVDVREGLREGVRPSLVAPLARKDALALPGLISSRTQNALGEVVNTLTQEGTFGLVKLFLIPGLQALYGIDPLYQAATTQSLGLDDFVQMEVVPPVGNEELPAARVTILNVDGQWLFIEGWHGDPDIRIGLTVSQALEIYKAALYDFKRAKTPTDKELISRKFEELQRSAVTYTRPDHK